VLPKKLTRKGLIAGAAPLMVAGPLAKLALADNSGEHDHLQLASHEGHGHATQGHAAMIGDQAPAVGGPRDLDALLYPPEPLPYRPGRVREYFLTAIDKEIEIAPGLFFPAWTYNGTVPGPVIRATEGDLLRVHFGNGGSHPHTIHFHGIHTSRMDGIPGIGAGDIAPGRSTTYEFDATPFGLHLYHCHSMPLAEHIAKGLYGAFIIDPKRGRPEADELVMVMNGFDTNFDRKNEVYAVNTVAFDYMHRPVVVRRNQLVRIYLVNALEFDVLNSFHVHANFFDYYPTGTRLEPRDFTDTVIQGQGERGILELRFPHTGKYMFHAHVSEFAELGWMGFFEVTD
jgi:FtsP/CotA-like multicopper oxidase with cupredoxin domain